MEWLDRFRKPLERRFDKTEGHPFVEKGVKLFASLDWEGLIHLYRQQGAADRTHFIQGLGETLPLDLPLPPRAENGALEAIKGGMLTVWAHRYRGFSTNDRAGHGVSDRLETTLSEANDALQRAAELTPNDSAIHTFRLRLLVLTQGNRQAFETIRAQLHASDELNVYAGLAELTYESPKWHGSTESMHRVADRYMANAPNAAFLGLKARAYIEDWLYYEYMNDYLSERNAYQRRIRGKAFKHSLATLDDAFHQRNSNASLSYSEGVFAYNQFAVLFDLYRDRRRQKPHIAAIGRTPSFTPWIYLAGDNINAYIDSARAELGLAEV